MAFRWLSFYYKYTHTHTHLYMAMRRFVHFISYIILTSVHAPRCHCVVNFILYLTRFKLSICFSAPQATTTCAYLYITCVCVCVCDVTLYRCWTWMFVNTHTLTLAHIFFCECVLCCGGVYYSKMLCMHTLICCQPFTMPRTIWHLLNWATWLLTHTGGGDGVYVCWKLARMRSWGWGGREWWVSDGFIGFPCFILLIDTILHELFVIYQEITKYSILCSRFFSCTHAHTHAYTL